MSYKKTIRQKDLDPEMALGEFGWSLAGDKEISWTGIRWDPNFPYTTMNRIGSTNWQQLFQDITLVALSDSGEVNATLATYGVPNISGAVDGTNGQVMVRIPRKYYREVFNSTGDLCGIDMSNYPLAGFKLHEKFSWGNGRGEIYVGAYEGSTSSGEYRSVSGVAVDHTKTLDNFRGLAAVRGSKWHAYDFYTHHLLQMLFYMYYAELNCQSALPAYTDFTWSGDGHEKRNTGRTNGLLSMNGYVTANTTGVDADLVGASAGLVIANRFLWLENFYGHCWKFLDGCAFDGRTGKPNTAYVTPDPTLFSSIDANILGSYINLNVNMPASPDANYIKSFGSLFIPKSFGGDSGSYVTDYFWSYLDNTSHNYLRVVIAGGRLDIGAQAGVAARHSIDVLGFADSSVVSRLCFEAN